MVPAIEPLGDRHSSPVQTLRAILPGIALAAGLAAASYRLATLPVLNVIGPLTVALTLGIAVRSGFGLPAWASSGTRFSARTILRLGIVLMGARLDFALVAGVGPKILLLDAVVILVGIVGIAWVGRRFGVPSRLATLLAVGTSVCGASAVVAAGSVTRAEDDEITLAVALCGVLGTSGVFFFVLAAPFSSLTTSQLAILSGSTLHEVAQVMAAASSWGTASGDLATVVKLTSDLVGANPPLSRMGHGSCRWKSPVLLERSTNSLVRDWLSIAWCRRLDKACSKCAQAGPVRGQHLFDGDCDGGDGAQYRLANVTSGGPQGILCRRRRVCRTCRHLTDLDPRDGNLNLIFDARNLSPRILRIQDENRVFLRVELSLLKV